MSTSGSKVRKHVNMMVDSTIKTMEKEELQVVLRSLLAQYPEITSSFKAEATVRLKKKINKEVPYLFFITEPSTKRATILKLDDFLLTENFIRSLIGVGLSKEALHKLLEIVEQVSSITWRDDDNYEAQDELLMDALAYIDADFVQVVQGLIEDQIASSELKLALSTALEKLNLCKDKIGKSEYLPEFPFERGLTAVSDLYNLQY